MIFDIVKIYKNLNDIFGDEAEILIFKSTKENSISIRFRYPNNHNLYDNSQIRIDEGMSQQEVDYRIEHAIRSLREL